MRSLRTCLVILLVLVTALSSPAFGQDRHIVDPAALAAAVDQHAARQDGDRAAIREALARPEVREMAARVGMDIERVTTTIGTLGGSDLERAGNAARQVNQALVGGASTLVISTTTIIIVLLVVLLLVVALK